MLSENNFGFPVEYDAVMIECKDKKITINSTVCVSAFDTKTSRWLCGLMMITSMKKALKCKLKKVSKDENVEKFLQKYYDKKGEDIESSKIKVK